jgi:hypothetical protein
VHAAIMAAQAFSDNREHVHLVGDVLARLLTAGAVELNRSFNLTAFDCGGSLFNHHKSMATSVRHGTQYVSSGGFRRVRLVWSLSA